MWLLNSWLNAFSILHAPQNIGSSSFWSEVDIVSIQSGAVLKIGTCPTEPSNSSGSSKRYSLGIWLAPVSKNYFFKKLANFMVQASPLSVLYTIHYTKRHSVCLGPDSKDRGVDLRAVVLIANMPRSIGWRERGGWNLAFEYWGWREFEIWPRARHTPTPAHFLWLVNIAKKWNEE